MKQVSYKIFGKLYLLIMLGIAILIAILISLVFSSIKKHWFKNDCISHTAVDQEDYYFANQLCDCMYDYLIERYRHINSFPLQSDYTLTDDLAFLNCLIKSSDSKLDSALIEYYKYLRKVLKHNDCNYTQEKYRVIYRLKDDGISFTIGDVKIAKGDTSRIASCTYSYQDKYYTSNKPIPDSVNVRNDTYFVLFSKFLPFINSTLRSSKLQKNVEKE